MKSNLLKNCWTVIWKIGLFFIFWGVIMAALLIPYMKLLNQFLPPEWSRLVTEIIPFITMLPAIWIITKLLEKRNLSTLGFQRKSIIYDTSIGFLIGIFWIIISFTGQFLFGTLFKGAHNSIPAGSFIIYGIALLINASLQEILFRGYLFQTIENNMNAISAIFITSVLFMGMHVGAIKAGIIPSLNVFGAGLVFAIAYYKTKNLWMPIAIHFVWNFSTSSILYTPLNEYHGLELFQLRGNTLLSGGETGVEATVITTFTIIIIIAIELFLIKPQTTNFSTINPMGNSTNKG
jgi:uncharacterized protein